MMPSGLNVICCITSCSARHNALDLLSEHDSRMDRSQRMTPFCIILFFSLSLFFFKVIAFTLDYDLARFNRTLPASDRLNQIKQIKKALMLWQGETFHVWICVSCTRTGH